MQTAFCDTYYSHIEIILYFHCSFSISLTADLQKCNVSIFLSHDSINGIIHDTLIINILYVYIGVPLVTTNPKT